MFAQLIVLFLVLVSTAAWNANTNKCFPGQYCDAPVTQVGTYASPQLCANKCAGISDVDFATYVPSSKQCLCSKTCKNTPVNRNPGADSYCLDDPIYTQCWTGKYCGPNSNIKTQPGMYPTPKHCATQCWNANHNFNFFNYVPSSQQCQCVTGCTLVENPYVSAFSIGSQTCTATNNPKLRA